MLTNKIIHERLLSLYHQDNINRYELLKLIKDLEKQLHEETAANHGQLNIYKFLSSFIQKVKKECPHSQAFHGVTQTLDGYAVCNGVVAIELHSIPDGLPMITGKPFNYKNLFDSTVTAQYDIDMKDLKFACDMAKTGKNIAVIDGSVEITPIENKIKMAVIVIDGKRHAFKAELMLDILKLLKEPELRFSDSIVEPIIIVGKNGRALLLPVREGQQE